MSDLKEKFDQTRTAIENEYAHVYHYPLLDIMRAANKDHTGTFNPQALKENGINPATFKKTWALGFAKETLSHGEPSDPLFAQVTIARCKTCLSEEGNLAFGTLLSEKIKTRLQQQLDTVVAAHHHLFDPS